MHILIFENGTVAESVRVKKSMNSLDMR